MRIALYAQNWRFGVMGLILSMREELKRRGHYVWHNDLTKEIMPSSSYKTVDQVWIVGGKAFSNFKKILNFFPNTPLIGFGLSDSGHVSSHVCKPYFSNLASVFTASPYYKMMLERKGIDVGLFLPSCHEGFHKNQGESRSGVVFAGNEKVSSFRRKGLEVARTLYPVRILLGFKGVNYVNALNKALIGLDFEVTGDSISHRLFEYAACGVCILVPYRMELEGVFEYNKEIVGYKTPEDMLKKLKYFYSHPSKAVEIGLAASIRCQNEHTMKHRLNLVFKYLKTKGLMEKN